MLILVPITILSIVLPNHPELSSRERIDFVFQILIPFIATLVGIMFLKTWDKMKIMLKIFTGGVFFLLIPLASLDYIFSKSALYILIPILSTIMGLFLFGLMRTKKK